MKVINLRLRGSVNPGTPVEESRAAALIKTGRWERAPGEPQLPIGCPAELAEREKRAAAERLAEEATAKKAEPEKKLVPPPSPTKAPPKDEG